MGDNNRDNCEEINEEEILIINEPTEESTVLYESNVISLFLLHLQLYHSSMITLKKIIVMRMLMFNNEDIPYTFIQTFNHFHVYLIAF